MSLDLTIIIPCHNDQPLLARLLSYISELRLARSVIVVDDGSHPAVDGSGLSRYYNAQQMSVTFLRQDISQGAGAARNLALAQVATAYVMFMDADDLPTRELPRLCWALAEQSFDFCLFQHHDSRMNQEHHWGQMPFDQSFWKQAGSLHRGTQTVSAPAATLLVQTANYPWNKIFRSSFLMEHAIRCSHTPVHNDIELHWRSFFHSKTLLSSDHVGMKHFVHDSGERITNRRSVDRLSVFIPLTLLAEELESSPELVRFRAPFFRFSLGLLLWVKANLNTDLHPELLKQTASFQALYLPQEIWTDLKSHEPKLIRSVTRELGLTGA